MINGTCVISPVILCGGSGTRLWPLSRKRYPKQFAPLLGQESLFQATVKRLSGACFGAPVIVTNADFRFIVAEQLDAIGVKPAAILIESVPRNTAPAVLAAALWLKQHGMGSLMLVAPSDHLMPHPSEFQKSVARSVVQADVGGIVTFGITPSRPETGYGYLEMKYAVDHADLHAQPQPLLRFVEKPHASRALEMISSGRHLWNSGIFLFSVATILKAYEQHASNLIVQVEDAVRAAQTDLAFIRLNQKSWNDAASISIDYAIMEKTDNLWVMPYGGGWSDLGGWEAVWTESSTDASGVASVGNVTALGCSDSLLRSEDDSIQLVGIGLKNMIAIAMPDAVLVADMSRVQAVKDAVAVLKSKGARQAETFPRDHRPWGWFESLMLAPGFQVKRIVVKPGAALSLQSHEYRAEHWVVVDGAADVTLDHQLFKLEANQSIYIPLGAKHRLANSSDKLLTIIEVQTGSYLGEDDIVRYEDAYSRA